MKTSRTAVVIGAGPAGLSAALGLLRSGYDVTVLDQRTKWSGRVCGAFLNPEAIIHLQWLGVLDEIRDQQAVPVSSTSVTGFHHHTRVQTIQQNNVALGFPRKNLEEILIQSVQKAGGEIRMGVRALQTEKDGDDWVTTTNAGAFIRSELLVNADGRFTLADNTHSLKTVEGWYGWNATFEGIQQQPGDMSLHVYPGGYVGLLTFSDGTTNVCGLVFRQLNEPLLWESVYARALEKNDVFRKTMSGARRVTEWQGVGPLPFSSALRNGNGTLLAGDAAAVGDPFMGEGIGRALGAGPMIHHTIQTVTRQGGRSADILRWYRSQWRRHYTSRLKMGYWARRAMTGPVLFPTITRILFYNQWLLKWATTQFHVGYNEIRPRSASRSMK